MLTHELFRLLSDFSLRQAAREEVPLAVLWRLPSAARRCLTGVDGALRRSSTCIGLMKSPITGRHCPHGP